MKPFLILLSLLLTLSLHAQSPGTATAHDDVTRDGLFDARLMGGNYIVRVNAIIALSRHEYISDGVARVVEVNITLNSAQIVRFYYLEPFKPQTGSSTLEVGTQTLERAQEAAGRISPDLSDPRVIKNYPTSTHAHTVEFVLKEEARLTSLYGTLERCFRTGQGRIWKEIP